MHSGEFPSGEKQNETREDVERRYRDLVAQIARAQSVVLGARDAGETKETIRALSAKEQELLDEQERMEAEYPWLAPYDR